MSATRRLSKLLAACRTKGIKLTGQRRAVLTAIANAHDHPDAHAVHELVSKSNANISLATVYRTVRTLSAAGLLDEHTFGDGRCHYEAADGPHHDHLIDEETGAIVEFCDPEIERLQHMVAARLGYRLTTHRLQLYGVRVDPPNS